LKVLEKKFFSFSSQNLFILHRHTKLGYICGT